jgi:hypothetical protein
MGMYVQNVPVKFISTNVVAGTPSYLDVMGFPYPLTITAIPGASGSVAVAYTTTPYGAASSGTVTWITWPLGTITATASDALLSPVAALRFTATTSNAVVEVNG